MGAPQTTVDPKGQQVAFAGLEADSDQVVDTVSAWSEEASAEIPFGIGIVQGTAAQGALLPSSSGDKFKGIVAFSFTHAPGTFGDLGTSGTSAGKRLRCFRKGRIWALVDKSVTVIAPFSDRGFCRYTADGVTNPQVGAWGIATDAGKNLDLTKIALFVGPLVTLADGTKIAKLEVDFTIKP